ncbi:GntR family transcriptional regulator [Streptomyces triticagri]|uniref:GntR family transcriptional regulator n=1 Tax=Streptomyces triticagri TaxID=2293568 RepID=A0A372M956_9ACTN|nr:GntR family transcriptional regulator [Streptomyces triticagri]RFU86827.1 GntR family transcriptional regulator [Streptomyces triticagri]
MLIRVDSAAARPLAEQIAASVRRALAEGELAPGDRLPSARETARLLEVNMHTVLRGYQILKAEGLIDLRPGRGAVVTATPERARIPELIDHLVEGARGAGVTDAELLSLVRSALGGPDQAGS